MNRLKIKNFKAYREELDELILDGKSFLVYGENGSGKSSIYEAIKVVFFRDRLLPDVASGTTPEVTTQIYNDFWNTYKNKNATESFFEIEVNNTNYADFDSNPYQVFMIAMDRLCVSGSLRLDELLENFDLKIEEINEFCHEHYETIETEVNSKLEEFQEKNISIVIDNEDDFSIKITDSTRGLDYKENIKNYFNEAKLNLIILLLLFEAIKCAKKSSKKKILVLDDFITSLDMSNRTFLMQYILEAFGDDFQIVILTHNVYFYNLIMYLVNDSFKVKDKWEFVNLYEVGSEHKLYMNSVIIKLSDIEDELNSDNPNFQTIGNQLRQKFERLLYEFSKSLMIGSVEESNKILKLIENSENIYFKKQGNRTSNELISEIENLLNENNDHNLSDRIKSKIDSYKLDDLDNIQKTLRELKLYRKVSMHSLSHGRIGQSSWSQKEIKQSLLLLKRLESSINSLNTPEQRRTDGL